MNTLEQVLAKRVYDRVKSFITSFPDENCKQRKEYASMAQRLPVLVHTAGLVQSLAYVSDQGTDSHKELLNHLAFVIDECEDADTLLNLSRTLPFQEYRYLTLQVNIALTWFKRFAQSVTVAPQTSDVG